MHVFLCQLDPINANINIIKVTVNDVNVFVLCLL